MYSSGLSVGRFREGRILEGISGGGLGRDEGRGCSQGLSSWGTNPWWAEQPLRRILGRGCIASKRKKYAREVMIVEVMRPDQLLELALYFTSFDLEDVVPHEDDPVVISFITIGSKVHWVLIDQGSSVDVMFWLTFNNLQLSPDQLRLYDGYLFGFARDQVDVWGHVKQRMTFSDGTPARTINIRYIVVNVVSAYNFLFGRPSLNRLGAMSSTRHMMMKFPSLMEAWSPSSLIRRRQRSATRAA